MTDDPQLVLMDPQPCWEETPGLASDGSWVGRYMDPYQVGPESYDWSEQFDQHTAPTAEHEPVQLGDKWYWKLRGPRCPKCSGELEGDDTALWCNPCTKLWPRKYIEATDQQRKDFAIARVRIGNIVGISRAREMTKSQVLALMNAEQFKAEQFVVDVPKPPTRTLSLPRIPALPLKKRKQLLKRKLKG